MISIAELIVSSLHVYKDFYGTPLYRLFLQTKSSKFEEMIHDANSTAIDLPRYQESTDDMKLFMMTAIEGLPSIICKEGELDPIAKPCMYSSRRVCQACIFNTMTMIPSL